MALRVLIIFDMLNGAAKPPEEPYKLRNSQRAIFKSLSAKFALNVPPFFTATTGKQKHPVLGQPVTQFQQDRFMTFQWKVEGAIPSRDQVVLARQLPRANIAYRKISIRISYSCQCDHRFRDIQPSALEPALLKDFYKPPFAPTANVQCMTAVLHELESARSGNTGPTWVVLPILSSQGLCEQKGWSGCSPPVSCHSAIASIRDLIKPLVLL